MVRCLNLRGISREGRVRAGVQTFQRTLEQDRRLPVIEGLMLEIVGEALDVRPSERRRRPGSTGREISCGPR